MKLLNVLMAFIIPMLSLQAGTNGKGKGGKKGTNPASTSRYNIGDYAEGGVVIWLTQDGQHGLVAAIKDAGTGLKWTSNGSYAQINATNNEPLPSSTPSTPYAQYYSGYKNQGIIEGVTEYNSTTYPAAYAAANFSYTDSTTNITYTDWWMPSSSELSLIYAARGVIDAVATAHNGDSLRRRFYWSSREEDSNGAWFLDVSSGNQYVNNKDDSYAVRCVRAF